MVFPQQNLINPKTLHLFVDEFDVLLTSGNTTITSFYQNCQTNCINFLSLYNIQVILPGNESTLENFINLGRTNYGICGFAGNVSLYDPATQGLDRPNTIITYNNNVSNSSNKITWVTIENEFWNLETTLNPLKTTTGLLMSTNAGSSIVNSTGINTVATVGNMLKVNNEWRQIISVSTNSLTLDRPLTVTLTNTTFQIRDNLVNQTNAIDFTTLLYRLKQLRTLCVTNDIKIEIYIGKSVTASQYNQIAPFVDRFLIEEELPTYPIYNDSSLQRVRQALLGAAANKTGTVTLFGTTLNGSGTQFTNDLGLNNSIIINGNEYIINTIVNDTQATVTSAPTSNITTPTTYSNYVHFAPIFYINPANAQSWMISSPSKSYVDVYRLIAINGYSIGSVSQSGNSPIAYNAETNTIITGSTYMDGMSIFARTFMQTIQSSVLSSPVPCSSCLSPTTYNISLSGSNPTCSSALNGSITVNFNGNNLTSPYTYRLTSGSTSISGVNSNTTYTFTGLTPNTFTVTVTDASLITSNSQTITLVQTLNPTITTLLNTIFFNLSGGTSPYRISSSPAGTFFVSGLTDGTYSYTATNGTYNFIVSDSNTCVTNRIPVTVDNTVNVVINASSTNPTCTAASNGKITANINSSGLAPYTYTYSRSGGPTINQVSNSITNTYSNAISGTWNVSVTDFNGDTSNTVSVTLTNTFAPTVTAGVNQVTFNLTGGTAPYTIVANTTPQLSASGLPSGFRRFTSIPSGTYTFTVTDANGCSSNLPATIIAGGNLSLNIANSVNPNCDLTANGSVTLSPGGGTPPYTIYSATNGTTIYTNTTGTFTGLTSNPWTFTVRDNIGGIATTTLTLLDKFNVNYTNTGTTLCISASGGSLGNYTVILNGTVYPYNTATTVNCYTGICGTNTFSVIDGNLSLSACVYTASTFLLCPLSVILSATPVTCRGINPTPNGRVTISATGGIPPYVYSLFNQSYPTLTNTTGIFNNLPVGTGLWSATTTDFSNVKVTNQFSISGTFNWSLNSNYTGICTTVSGGSSPYKITVYGPLETTPNLFGEYTANTQGTYCFSAETGTYSIQVRDKNMCSYDNLSVSYYFSTFNLDTSNYISPTCDNPIGGVAYLTPIGGIPPYVSYTATNGTFLYTKTNNVFSGLSVGNWTFYVKDSTGSIVQNSLEFSPFIDGFTITGSTDYANKTVTFEVLNPGINSYYDLTINDDKYIYYPNNPIILSIPITGCGDYNFYVEGCANPYVDNNLYNFSVTSGFIPPNITKSLVKYNGIFYGSTYGDPNYNGGSLFTADTLGNVGIILNLTIGYGNPTATPTIGSDGYLYIKTRYFIYKYNLSANTLNSYYTVSFLEIGGNKLFEGSDGYFYGSTIDTNFSPISNGTLNRFNSGNGVTTTFATTSGMTSLNLCTPRTAFIEPMPGILYGVTESGGTSNQGAYFKVIMSSITVSSSTIINLGSFNSSIGSNPSLEEMVYYNGRLYGVSPKGGINNCGTLWSITVSSDTLTKIFDFGDADTTGKNPVGLTLGSDNLLYGTTKYGGHYYPNTNDGGVIFSYNPDTNEFLKLIDSDGTNFSLLDGGIIEYNNVFYGLSHKSYGNMFSLNKVPYNNCCVTYNHPTVSFIDKEIYGTYINGNPHACVSINNNSVNKGPYTVFLNNVEYSWSAGTTLNCYGISACTTTDVYIKAYNGYQDNYSVFYYWFPPGENVACTLTEGYNGTLYGTTYGTSAIFSVDTGGTYTQLYASYGDNLYNEGVNFYDGFLYGVTQFGGLFNYGTIFSFDITANTINVLYDGFNFTTSGGIPYGKPILHSNGILYGTTGNGGAYNNGVIYSCTTSGNFGVIYNLNGYYDGITPKATLIEVNNGVLYGTTYQGGFYNYGTIFSCDTLGNFGVIHTFINTANPYGGVIEVYDGILYGTTESGGAFNFGTIYSCTTSGNFGIVHSFGNGYNSRSDLLKVIRGNDLILYGTTNGGGTYGYGTVFNYNLTNKNFNIVHNFSGGTEGITPFGGLIESSNGLLYGTTDGNISDNATIFSLNPIIGYCYTETTSISLSSGFTGFDITPTWVNGQAKICIDIDENTFLPPPYQVTIQGNTYGYNNSLSANCYTITGCSGVTITITNNDIDYSYSNLIYFTGTTSGGTNPIDSLVLASNGLFYGVTLYGGTFNVGTIYSANTLGQKGVIHNFNTTTPVGTIIQKPLLQASNGILYGTTFFGGISNNGIIYSCDTSGNFGTIHTFSLISGGTNPIAGLIQASNGILYGTTYTGGINNNGIIYSCDTLGNFGVIVLNTLNSIIQFNSSLIQASNGILYGTSESGLNNDGILFSCSTSGNWGIVLDFSAPGIYGTTPYSIIEASNGYLYGVCNDGGPAGLNCGVLYRTTKNGQYTLIHEFSGTTYGDGQLPQNQLFQANDGTIYGTTTVGGLFNKGTIFTVDLNDNYNIIHHFSGQTYFDGDNPRTTLIQGNDGNLYGTTYQGGTSSNNGTMFKLGLSIITGCTYTTIFDVPCIEPFSLSVLGTTIPCSANTGVISVLASGGIPPYTYRLNNGQIVTVRTGTTNNTIVYSGLSANSYRITALDSSTNSAVTITNLSFINSVLTTPSQNLCITVTGTNNVSHYVYIDNILEYTSTGNIFTQCFTGITCGVFHTLKIVDSSTGCLFVKPFRITCPPLRINEFVQINPFANNTPAVITVGVTGGSSSYTYTLEEISPFVSSATPSLVVNNSPIFPYNYATFLIDPPQGTWFAKIVDSNGTIANTSNFTLSNIFYANVVFTPTTATVTFSGGSYTGGYTNVNVNGVPYNFLNDGTYQYSIPCGYNEVIVQGVTNVDVIPLTITNVTFTANTICPLWSGYMFDQPICAGSEIEFITVYVTGGTPDYRISLSNGTTTYTGLTSTSPFNFFTGGINPIDITGGTWTITTTDNNGNTYNQTINIDATFDAFASQLTTSGVFITVSGGTPLYNITIDSTDYGSNYGNGEHYFSATTGLHTAVVSQPFGSGTIPPPINCFPIYADTTSFDMYYFDTVTQTSNFYFTPVTFDAFFCRDNDNIWISIVGTQIDEYSTTTTPPTFVRSINTAINNIFPAGIYPWTSPNKLMILQGNSGANQVQIIDISTNTATIDSTLYTIRPGRIFQSLNLYRDNSNGISYFMTCEPGGANPQYDAYYDNGTLYASAQTTVTVYGSCIIGNQLYIIDNSGSFSSVTYSLGTLVFGSSPYSINNFLFGVAQAPECDSPTVQPTNTCPQTFNFRIPAKPISCNYIYTNPTCGNDIGSVLVTVTGGTGLFTYSITDGINTYTSTPPLSPYSSYPFNGLGPGTWQLSVIDSDGSTCTNTINLTSNFSVSATSYSNNSYTVGSICVDIQGGTPPYNIFIDNIIRLSATTNLSNCFTATTNTTHTYRVEDSSPPCTIYTNVQMINDTTFDVPTNWVANTTGNCNNSSIPNFGITGGTVVAGGNITYTSTTKIAVPGTSGCFQNVFFRENYVNPNPFTAGKPISATYEFQIDFGVKLNMVYAAPFLLTPITNPYFARYDILNSFGNGPANPITGIVTPPIASNYLNNTLYSGLVKIYTDNTLTYPPVVFSGYGVFIGASGSYNGSVGQIQYRGYNLRLLSYDIPCSCSASGTTFVSPTPSPQIGLLGFTNPSCESATNGIISVSGSSGVPPYVYSATNGTTNYTNINGIFNGLNSGTWYLSLVDSLGATATLAQPITLYDTFYADVDSYSNGYCVSITGGTQPYYVAVNGNPLNWNYNFDTNCYSATCNTTSVITVRDSS